MRMCKQIAVATFDDGVLSLDVSCLDHGTVAPTLELPENQIEMFLEEGYFGVAIGAVSRETFDMVVNAIVAAGIRVAGKYRGN